LNYLKQLDHHLAWLSNEELWILPVWTTIVGGGLELARVRQRKAEFRHTNVNRRRIVPQGQLKVAHHFVSV
jgi:cytochrome c-type biogenesis protein CcmH/NrfF